MTRVNQAFGRLKYGLSACGGRNVRLLKTEGFEGRGTWGACERAMHIRF